MSNICSTDSLLVFARYLVDRSRTPGLVVRHEQELVARLQLACPEPSQKRRELPLLTDSESQSLSGAPEALAKCS